MDPFIKEPPKIPPLLRFAIWLVERRMGKRMTPARLLSWYPKAAVGSGIMEGLVAHDEREVPRRTLQLLRMQVSIQASCPFCIDMNSADYLASKITKEEVASLRALAEPAWAPSLSEPERVALEYARALTATPIAIPETLPARLRESYSERGVAIVVSTVAQVNFWTRAIQGFGLPPLGFTEACPVDLDAYVTIRREGPG